MSERDAIHTPNADKTQTGEGAAVEYGLTFSPSDPRVVGAARVLLEWLLSTPEHEAELRRRMAAVTRQDSPAGESATRKGLTSGRTRKRAA